MSDRSHPAARVVSLLEALRRERGELAQLPRRAARLAALKAWQSERLRRSFSDLLADPRYAPAAAFFVEELYGAHDVSWRDRDLARMLPTLRRWLPAAMLETVGDALELDLASHRLDVAMLAALPSRVDPASMSVADYGSAYASSATPAAREHQLQLLLEVGTDLDAIVARPLIFGILRLARGPAHAAGLGQLQGFLERGFGAFREMRGAKGFLAEVERREGEVMRRLFARHPAPFDVAREQPRG